MGLNVGFNVGLPNSFVLILCYFSYTLVSCYLILFIYIILCNIVIYFILFIVIYFILFIVIYFILFSLPCI